MPSAAKSLPQHMMLREGRYYARMIVPERLRPYLEPGIKPDQRRPLGADYRQALRDLPSAVVEIQHIIAMAEQRAARAKGVPVGDRARYPKTADALALVHYRRRLGDDEKLRTLPYAHYHTSIGIDDGHVARLRATMGGRLSDEELDTLIGDQVERYRALGNLDSLKGSPEWRAFAQALCVAEYEFLGRMLERDDGNFKGQPDHPMLAKAEEAPEELPPVSLKGLFRDYVKAREAVGRGRSIEGRWAPVLESLRKHMGHDDARRITKGDLLTWRDKLLGELSAKTVADVHLASVRAILKWAHENDKLPENVAEGVKQEKPKTVRTREKGYTDAEAVALLKVAQSYVPKVGPTRSTTEGVELTRAKRWVPWLCAFTGSRITEMTQLRGQDFREEAGGWVVRITPEAGSVKSGNFRDVPLHPQLVELGLLNMVAEAGQGPLFWKDGPDRDPMKAARMVSGRLSEWIGELGLAPEGVAPNHGWRHRFKSVAIDLGEPGRVIDAIQDHAAQTAGETYGDVSILAKRRVINAFPHYSMER